ncbi:MAG: glucose PTS transporter subunit IIA [Actinomycetaceae bacterium]|nr:glucose PTS transporter subunit IIA [Actinomycetaceae bacterium]
MFGFGKKKLNVKAPFAGEVVAVTEVPDPMFADRLLGDGFAVTPSADVVDVCAPVDGTIVKVFGTLHAFAMKSDDHDTEVFVHIGLETVELEGKHFERLAEEGAKVKAGTPVVRLDVAAVKEAGYNPITPVVFTKRGQVESVDVTTGSTDGSQVVCVATLA